MLFGTVTEIRKRSEAIAATFRDPKNPQKTIVLIDDATAWLQRRPSFQPTRLNAGIDGQASFRDAEGLSQVCLQFREQAGLSVRQLREMLEWTAAETLAYQNMERGAFAPEAEVFDATRLMALGRALKLPAVEQFARDAIRVVYHARAAAQIKQQMEALCK